MTTEGRPTRRGVTILAGLLMVAGAMLLGGAAPPSDAGARLQQVIAGELAKPFPSLDPGAAPDTFDLGYLNAALAGFAAGDPAAAALANERLDAVLQVLQRQPVYKGVKPPPQPGRPADDDEFHFEIAQSLFRIFAAYGPGGRVRPGLLNHDNAARVADIFFDWAKENCQIADPLALRTWDIWGSENHGAQRDSSCWAAAALLAANPAYAARPYDDGSAAPAQLHAWTAFLCRYLSERAAHGALVEYFSPTYAQYTLMNYYLYLDFTSDPKLRRLARASLDLWWAMWAQESVDGIHGGSKTRSYAKSIPDGTPMPTATWVYFGLGPKPVHLPPGEAGALASPYRPPELVAAIATDRVARGSYDVWTRAPGLAERPFGRDHLYHVDSQQNGVLRFAHVTPDYVMGLGMVPLLPRDRWTAISGQNRWAGLVMAGGDPRARIVPAVVASDGAKQYDALFGVQSGGLQVVRAMTPEGGRMRVWFGRTLHRTEAQGWVFVDGAAYAAVRPTQGGWHWDPADPQWLVPDDPDAAIVVQAAARDDYAGLPAFMAAAAGIRIRVANGAVTVAGLGAAGTVALGLGSNGLMQINGHDALLQPPFVFKSPFVNAALGQPQVTLRNEGHEMVLDFSD